MKERKEIRGRWHGKQVLVCLVGIAILCWCLYSFLSQEGTSQPTSYSDNLDYGTPSTNLNVIERKGYALGYNSKWKQAQWVAYRLTRDEVLSNVCERTNAFAKDPVIRLDYATPADYARSGYDKGHLAPAADMSWSKDAMAECFYMSNMSPQAPMFNRGIWKHLETWVRNRALEETSIFVITGPIVSSNDVYNTIGRNRVVVPSCFYKVVFDESPPQKMIAFVMPNQGSDKGISYYATSVDEVERISGLDFFDALPDKVEEELEREFDFRGWGKGCPK